VFPNTENVADCDLGSMGVVVIYESVKNSWQKYLRTDDSAKNLIFIEK
jgi:hypothetical protein